MESLEELISGTPVERFLDTALKNKIRVCRYVRGARIRFSECILFLVKGTVSFTYGDAEGNPYHVISAKAFNTIGELVHYYDRRISDIITLEDSIVLEFPLELINELEKNKDFQIYILKQANLNLIELTDKMLKRNTYKLENYLAYVIISDQLNDKYHYKSMTSLAAALNVSRRNLYYSVESLVDQGFIRKGNSAFEILNEPRLREMI